MDPAQSELKKAANPVPSLDISYLVLALTTRCNLACSYCYNGFRPEGADMDPKVLKSALDLAGSGRGPLHIQLTGGEPTLVPHILKKALHQARRLKRPYTIGIQTNGTNLTPDLIKWFKEVNIQVGVSLDGPPAVHQQLRGQAAQTLRGLQLLENHQVPFRVTTVVSRHNVDHLDRLVLVLAGFSQARGVGLDLLVNKGRACHNTSVIAADEAALDRGLEAMLKVFSTVNGRRPIPIQLRELELLKKRFKSKEEKHYFCFAAQGRSMAVDPEGRLFPCSQTLGDKHFAAGTVRRPAVLALTGLSSYHLVSAKCGQCPLHGFCPNECPSRLYYNGPDASPLACRLYRTLANHLGQL